MVPLLQSLLPFPFRYVSIVNDCFSNMDGMGEEDEHDSDSEADEEDEDSMSEEDERWVSGAEFYQLRERRSCRSPG